MRANRAIVAKRKTLFDDKSTQIQELIYVIKHDISELNNDIGNLQQFVKLQKSSRGKGNKEVDEHSDNVVVLLQSKLANTSMGFKDVLEIRTQVIFPIPPHAANLTIRILLFVEYESLERSVRAVHCRGCTIRNTTTKYLPPAPDFLRTH